MTIMSVASKCWRPHNTDRLVNTNGSGQTTKAMPVIERFVPGSEV